jgi:hypothetical protein
VVVEDAVKDADFLAIVAASEQGMRLSPDAGSVPVVRDPSPRKSGCGCKGKRRKKKGGLMLAVGAAALAGFGLAMLRK